jgi:hypothetical protein
MNSWWQRWGATRFVFHWPVRLRQALQLLFLRSSYALADSLAEFVGCLWGTYRSRSVGTMSKSEAGQRRCPESVSASG